jgi:UDP:flavonoid glycosyltransferase YjiC (YdhE family)
MRVLFASSPGSGHFTPLIPFADALRRAGHTVLLAGPPSLCDAATYAGHEFWPVDVPDPAELRAVWSRVPPRSREGHEIASIAAVHARLEADISLPRLLEACEDWQADVVVRDPSQFGAAIAAELSGIPHVRVATGLMAGEQRALEIAAPAVDELRRAVGLPADPDASILRASPYLTLLPASFEDPDSAARQPVTRRFRDPAWDAAGSAQADAATEPSVYVALDDADVRRAIAALPVRATDELASADAVVSRADTPSLLRALAAGLPVVAVPQSGDEASNTRRLVAVGAGLEVPHDADVIAAAVTGVLANPKCRAAARRAAAEMRQRPSVDQVANVLPRRTATRDRLWTA